MAEDARLLFRKKGLLTKDDEPTEQGRMIYVRLRPFLSKTHKGILTMPLDKSLTNEFNFVKSYAKRHDLLQSGSRDPGNEPLYGYVTDFIDYADKHEEIKSKMRQK